MDNKHESIAKALRVASDTRVTMGPIRDQIGPDDIEAAYAIQKINTDFYTEQGRKICGRKIGLTSPAVQKQLGVDQPDFGVLYTDMQFADGDEVPWARLIQPKIEAEIALVLGTDLTKDGIDNDTILNAVDHALPALEIVGSRIANWQINICDTVADNASSGVYVLGSTPADKNKIDWRLCGMSMEKNGESVSSGCGAACLGNPINAAVWLANTMLRYEMPLMAGDIILTGALGPMAAVQPGDAVMAKINGVGHVSVTIGVESN